MHANTEPARSSIESFVFIIHFWREDQTTDAPTWRGKIQNIQNKEVDYFRGWNGLTDKLKKKLDELTNDIAASVGS